MTTQNEVKTPRTDALPNQIFEITRDCDPRSAQGVIIDQLYKHARQLELQQTKAELEESNTRITKLLKTHETMSKELMDCQRRCREIRHAEQDSALQTAIQNLITDFTAKGLGQDKSSKEWGAAYPDCAQSAYRAGAANTLTEVAEKLTAAMNSSCGKAVDKSCDDIKAELEAAKRWGRVYRDKHFKLREKIANAMKLDEYSSPAELMKIDAATLRK